jgi:hypothetical protein
MPSSSAPAAVLEVLGEVDGGHAAAPDLALQPVTVGEGEAHAVGGVEHDELVHAEDVLKDTRRVRRRPPAVLTAHPADRTLNEP